MGSSDAAAVYSFEASSGRLAWKQDVRGWAWGQPALGDGSARDGVVRLPRFAGGGGSRVFVGGLDGRVHALAP